MPSLPRLVSVATALVTLSAAGYWGTVHLSSEPFRVVAAAVDLSGVPANAPARPATTLAATPGPVATPSPVTTSGPATTPDLATTSDPVAGVFPGLGPRTAARIPAAARQVVVVRGDDDARATVALYVHGPAGWTTSEVWTARTGKAGWATPERRTDGSLQSPAGVFTLSDAGGRAAAPSGTTLPYSRSDRFASSGRGLDGGSLHGVFDYVVAIDFNRVRGRSPLDAERPDGRRRGSGIWFHVEHTGPTRGCVALPRAAMVSLLRTLTPTARPVVVMGPGADLDR